ncbi:MAG TPA: transglutaminase domain-containing protein [Candidatus Sulfotelmatobacter sp.]|nr:transglutaminase domain-containing protein [Candidatus Sulfotelmatobacter sp.]
MIAEIIPEAYDADGHQVSQPFHGRKLPRPTFPIGRYVSQPLTVECKTMHEVRQFLATCKYVSDKELFGKRDYWQPPEEFEKRKRGDCEDFAFWTWRQLLSMGYDARFVGGSAGRYGSGHAWVEYFQDGKCFLLEPLNRLLGETLPRLSTLKYAPKVSISWDGETLRYYSHKQPESPIPWRVLIPLVPEYFVFWMSISVKLLLHLPLIAWRILLRRVAH